MHSNRCTRDWDLTFAHDLVARHVGNPLASSVLVSTHRTKTQLATTFREFPGIHILDPAAADSLRAERLQANAEVNDLRPARQLS